MNTVRPPLSPTAPRFKVLLLCAFSIALFAMSTAAQQENANSVNANANMTNANANANRSANANLNANGNSNRPTNANANLNANQSADDTALAERAEARKDILANTTWFYTIVTLMFGLVLIPFVLTIWRSIRFSKSTYNNPLGLPVGSFRAILAYTLVSFLGFYILASILSLSDFQPPDFLLGIVATVIGFYFGSRSGDEESAGGAARTAVVQGRVLDATGGAAAKATVELFQSGVKKQTHIADGNGAYRFDGVPAGDYTIKATLATASSDELRVSVKAGATQTVELKLR
jgi:hypothetical protein